MYKLAKLTPSGVERLKSIKFNDKSLSLEDVYKTAKTMSQGFTVAHADAQKIDAMTWQHLEKVGFIKSSDVKTDITVVAIPDDIKLSTTVNQQWQWTPPPTKIFTKRPPHNSKFKFQIGDRVIIKIPSDRLDNTQSQIGTIIKQDRTMDEVKRYNNIYDIEMEYGLTKVSAFEFDLEKFTIQKTPPPTKLKIGDKVKPKIGYYTGELCYVVAIATHSNNYIGVLPSHSSVAEYFYNEEFVEFVERPQPHVWSQKPSVKHTDFKEGDAVKIIDGFFSGREGVVKYVYQNDERIQIVLDDEVTNRMFQKNDLELIVQQQTLPQPIRAEKPEKQFPLCKKFMHKFQWEAVMDYEEERDDVLQNVEAMLKKIPRRQNVKFEESVVWAHYFVGGSDWFILDAHGDYFFLYAILNSDTQMSELGSEFISEMTSIGSGYNHPQLDFYWQPKFLAEALHDAYPDDFKKPPQTYEQFKESIVEANKGSEIKHGDFTKIDDIPKFTPSVKEMLETKIKGFQTALKFAKTDDAKKVIETKIKGFQTAMKFAK